MFKHQRWLRRSCTFSPINRESSARGAVVSNERRGDVLPAWEEARVLQPALEARRASRSQTQKPPEGQGHFVCGTVPHEEGPQNPLL